MCDFSLKNSIPDLYLCIELLDALAILPIINKTVLRDSKVLERVEKWSNLDLDKKKLTKEEKKQAKANKKKNKSKGVNSENETLQDGKEEENFQVSSFTQAFDVLEEMPTMRLLVKEKAALLLQKWEVLKEDFRIPKKQKQENRKEHEKEAGMEDELCYENQQKASTTNDRSKSRYGNEVAAAIRNTPYQPPSSSSAYRRYIDPVERQYRRQQFEKRMEQIEHDKKMYTDHEENCAFFGLSPGNLIVQNI